MKFVYHFKSNGSETKSVTTWATTSMARPMTTLTETCSALNEPQKIEKNKHMKEKQKVIHIKQDMNYANIDNEVFKELNILSNYLNENEIKCKKEDKDQ